ncbi:TIGR02281 family clan AA aspartic protease [Sphingobium sp. AN558]|uniref:retropepsin-like aspartic protease family protein n=1 Tax=Sphingobium sp. AN558 TaxID=3133442 RepID=UPI0030C40F1F
MATDQAMSGLWYILALVLVGSAVLARRMPLGGVFRMALLWIAIFGGLFGLFTLGQRSGLVPADVGLADGVPTGGPPSAIPPTRTQGHALRIPVSRDGHYWVEATVNGAPARFLIDSGASVTALSVDSARGAGLNFDMNAPGVQMVTANGRIDAKRSAISTLAIGPIRVSDLDVVVSPSFGDVNVIGMNLLSRLRSWGVQDGQMVLTP